MKKEDSIKILKDLKDKGLKKLKEQNIPDKLKNLKDKGLEKLEEQNFQEKFKNLKDKGLEVAKDTYNKNKSDDAGWRKFLSANPKVKYALYGLCGLLVMYWIIPSNNSETCDNEECPMTKEEQQQETIAALQNKISELENSKEETKSQPQVKYDKDHIYSASEVNCASKGNSIKECYSSADSRQLITGKVHMDNGLGRSILGSEVYASDIIDVELKDGRLDGVAKIFNEDNNLLYEANYKNGKLDGNVKKYDRHTFLLYLDENYKDGKKDGKYKKYYPDGTVEYEVEYKDDAYNGKEKRYYEDGSLKYETNYVNGKKEGVHIEYSENVPDIKIVEENYKNNLLHGSKKNYDKIGKITLEENYAYGKLDGISKYYKDGNLMREDTYKNGKLDGVMKGYDYKGYDYEGDLLFELNFKKGKLDGVGKILTSPIESTLIFKNGILTSEKDYLNTEGGRILLEETNSEYLQTCESPAYTKFLNQHSDIVEKHQSLYINPTHPIKNEDLYLDYDYGWDKKICKHGIHKVYDHHGNLVVDEKYDHGKLDGVQRLYCNYSLVQWEDGTEEWGVIEEVDIDKLKYRYFCPHTLNKGTQDKEKITATLLYRETNFVKGVIDGTEKTFYSDRQLESEITYKMGEIISAKKYDSDGYLIEE